MNANFLLFQAAAGIFAITGVLAAARQNMDVMSFVIVGIVTAIGGGTLRDLTLGVPAFWLHEPSYLYVAAGAAVATFFFEQRFRATYRAFLYLDAAATAIFCIIATERTHNLGFGPGVAVAMGVLTGVGGGVLRDLLTGQPTLLTRRELFMTPIFLGAALYTAGLHFVHDGREWLEGVAIFLIAAVRICAIYREWAFPDWLTYKPYRKVSR